MAIVLATFNEYPSILYSCYTQNNGTIMKFCLVFKCMLDMFVGTSNCVEVTSSAPPFTFYVMHALYKNLSFEKYFSYGVIPR